MTSNPHNPDPLAPPHWLQEQLDEAYDAGIADAHRLHVLAWVLAVGLGIVIGFVIAGSVFATSRSGLQSGDSFSAGRSEAPQDADRPASPRLPETWEQRGSARKMATPTATPRPARPLDGDAAPSHCPEGSCGASPAPPLAAPTQLSDEGGISSALVAGTASWYDVGPGLYGAVPSYRWGDPRYKVRVCRLDKPSRCVTVTVLDFCGCPGSRVIDLSRQAFARLESPSRGLVAVTVESGGGGPDATLPATDSDGR